VVAVVFGANAAIAIAVETCEWLFGEERERLFENWGTSVSILYLEYLGHKSWKLCRACDTPFKFSILGLVAMMF
jgi:hypothetical protein